MKYSQWIGIAAAVLLVVACFLPWTFHPDLNKSFTGFFSEENNYGKPGKVFIGLAVVATIFFITPRIWAKRWNLLVGALTVAFAIKSFIVFSGCYKGICPAKQAGLWIMLGAAIIMLVMTLVPDMKVGEQKN
ncbi:hypothetical protein HB364_15645 [Pseudoflavitalea sp. X16]|uniref:hypothetical protein n=1 Tax=Paraflavitalea devenefica TaxID=2716334 RepID=UPI00142492DD|nr:hypothetical protein [Paraflavitalea devenefica]NII26522.1 hypothetical protein [Paraflavitalea devenefica]